MKMNFASNGTDIFMNQMGSESAYAMIDSTNASTSKLSVSQDPSTLMRESSLANTEYSLINQSKSPIAEGTENHDITKAAPDTIFSPKAYALKCISS